MLPVAAVVAGLVVFIVTPLFAKAEAGSFPFSLCCVCVVNYYSHHIADLWRTSAIRNDHHLGRIARPTPSDPK